jgi:hypothetical protein
VILMKKFKSLVEILGMGLQLYLFEEE